MLCNAIKNLSKTLYLKKICKNRFDFCRFNKVFIIDFNMPWQIKPFFWMVFRKSEKFLLQHHHLKEYI
jgi:hypothetical protein